MALAETKFTYYVYLIGHPIRNTYLYGERYPVPPTFSGRDSEG